MTSSSKLGSRQYGVGVREGTHLLSEDQYQIMIKFSPDSKFDFVRVRSRSSWMWRYKWAYTPYVAPSYEFSNIDETDVIDVWYREFVELASRFQQTFSDHKFAISFVAMIEGDEDEDFTYGAFISALRDMRISEDDWLFTHEFGKMYTIQHLDTLTDNG